MKKWSTSTAMIDHGSLYLAATLDSSRSWNPFITTANLHVKPLRGRRALGVLSTGLRIKCQPRGCVVCLSTILQTTTKVNTKFRNRHPGLVENAKRNGKSYERKTEKFIKTRQCCILLCKFILKTRNAWFQTQMLLFQKFSSPHKASPMCLGSSR